jgi:hypothetical protein
VSSTTIIHEDYLTIATTPPITTITPLAITSENTVTTRIDSTDTTIATSTPTLFTSFTNFTASVTLIKCRKRYRFKKATLYELEVTKKNKNYLFAGRSFHRPTHTTGG